MIGNVVKYVQSRRDRPWLILGKGPTSDQFVSIDETQYHVLTLNHACRLPKTIALAHFVDIEAFHECGSKLAQDEVATCLPWYPHAGSAAGKRTLVQYCGLFKDEFPSSLQALGWLCAKEKLFSYNASTASAKVHIPNQNLPSIRLRFFSAVGAFNVLAAAGLKTIHTLGVDGGTGYGRSFDTKDRLANGRASFDDQTSQLLDTCRRHQVQWVKLSGKETV